ncbi:NAD(P)-binding protein [Streptosporangium sp. NBC_01755]|nr:MULTISPECIES: NAD(P)-binding protein [unclassified Streptosporangium]WSA28372.1 NAD(P)-binding protein [Streptosporangium sp. NBC_01810]WSD00138.1 NAD(P)-binding protein [Streptosporangium sp. NBC_01755]
MTVIGGGAGGMVCALLPARRGHRVRLYERPPTSAANSLR